MSIATHIAGLEKAGKLARYIPRSRLAPKRRLYLTESALKDLESKDSVVNILALRGAVESALTHWVTGMRIHADPGGRPRFLKRLDGPPPEIWEIRVTEPRVHLRLLGRFPEPDTLVLTKFHTRGVLGERDTGDWQKAMTACEAGYDTLLPGMLFKGTSIHDYVTDNCDDFKI